MLKRTVVLCLLLAGSATVFAQSFSFFPFDDKGNGGSSEIKMDSTMETIQGKEYPVSTITGKVTNKYQYGFIGVAVKPDPKMLELLKSAKGIKFKVIGDGQKYRVKVETSDITDFDHYGKEFATKKGEPVEITVPYSALVQEGWGAKKKFNLASILQLGFQTIGQPIPSVSLKIFDIQPLN